MTLPVGPSCLPGGVFFSTTPRGYIYTTQLVSTNVPKGGTRNRSACLEAIRETIGRPMILTVLTILRELGYYGYKALIALGPVCIGAAVFWQSRTQANFTKAMQKRVALVEDQKLRLALLDKRFEASEAISTATSDYMETWEPKESAEALRRLDRAIMVAQLIFEDGILAQFNSIRALIEEIVEIRQRYFEFARSEEAESLLMGEYTRGMCRSLTGPSERLEQELKWLPYSLRDATRVSEIPPLG